MEHKITCCVLNTSCLECGVRQLERALGGRDIPRCSRCARLKRVRIAFKVKSK